jgi:hypothetical protein
MDDLLGGVANTPEGDGIPQYLIFEVECLGTYEM